MRQLHNDVTRETEAVRRLGAASFSKVVRAVRSAISDSKPKDHRHLYVCAAALTNEALHRTSGREFYPTQLMAGDVIRDNGVAQMQTGEGKTLVTLLPAVWHVLSGRQAHVATTNDYLAERDREELQPVFELLGITTGLTLQESTPDETSEAYGCDVVFGSGSTFGFDYLKDQVTRQQTASRRMGMKFIHRLRNAYSEQIIRQQLRDVTIVDEADSILLDEAITPLILSGATADSATPENLTLYKLAQDCAATLKEETHFIHDPQKRRISFTDDGWAKLHTVDINGLALNRPWSEYVSKALQAERVYAKDVDYVVRDDKVQIVDQNTGRIDPDRSWQDGLHQAIEFREGTTVTDEGSTTARITRQNFYRLYNALGGMTGTAVGSEAELKEMYKVDVVEIPLFRPSQRQQMPTRWFATADAKHKAIAASAREMLSIGRPVLIGTATIEQSLQIAEQLEQGQLPHVVLNGIQDADEADIVKKAGLSGRITIATNMAGRGTDIKPNKAALKAGGLHCIATQHHESPRVDRQLIGRTARQGQPGSFQYFISAEDRLVANDEGSLAERMVAASGPDGESRKSFQSDIQAIQQAHEVRGRRARRNLLEQEAWLNEVRSSVG